MAKLQTADRLTPRKVEAYAQLPIATFADWDRVWQIRNMLSALEAGGAFNQAAIFVDGMFRDDRVSGVIGTRASALVGSDVEFKGANAKRKAAKIAEELLGSDEQPGLWDTICPPWAAVEMLVWGFMLGIAVGELVWDTSNPTKWTPTLRVWHPQFLRYDWNANRYYLQTGEKSDGIIELPNVEDSPNSDGHWVIWCPYGYRNVWRRALLRPLAMLFLCRQWTYRDWARYNEKHGSPTDIVKVPEDAPEEEKQYLRDQLANRGSDATIVLPQGMSTDPAYDISILEAQGGSHESFEAQIAKLETNIAICVLGQNLTTEVQGGSRAAAQVHDNVRLDKLREDARITTCFRAQILSWWAGFNYGDPELAPRMRYLVDPPDDEVAEVQTLEGLGAALSALQLAGVKVDVDCLVDRFGVPVEKEEDLLDDNGDPIVAPVQADLALPPDAINAITKVNEARGAAGLGPLLAADGTPDPDGELTVVQYQTKHGQASEPASGRALNRANEPASERSQVALAQVEDGARRLTGRAARALRGAQTVAGRKRMAKYAEALQALAKQRAKRATAVDLAELQDVIDGVAKEMPGASDKAKLKALRGRVLARYRGGMSGAALARVVERTTIMAQLGGQLGALEDI